MDASQDISSTRKAVIYVRISSSKQLTDGDGIRSQESACRDYARYKGLEVVHVFRDVMSGKHKSRPDMDKMLDFLRTRQNENYAVIIDDISRLARDIITHIALRTDITAAGGELMSPSIEFSDNPQAQLPEKIMALVKEQERIDNAARSKSRSIARLKAGYWVFSAPVGFKYIKAKGDGGGKVLVRDEPVATIVADALEKFASGYFGSQVEMKRHLEDHPSFPKSASGKIGNEQVRLMLTRPHYAGYIAHEDWGVPLIKAKHEGLISYQTYLKIQDQLGGKKQFPVRKSINPEFPLRGLVDCADCGTTLTAANSQGRNKKYGYYGCKVKDCASYGKSIRKEKIEAEFETLLTGLRPSRELIEIATVMFKAVWEKHMKAFKERQKAAKNALNGVEQKIDNLVTRIVQATQPALITAYEGELVKLETQRTIANEQIEQFGGENSGKGPNFEAAYRTAMGFLSNPLTLWKSSRVEHKRMVVKLAFGTHVSYCRENGYRTTEMSLPFQIIQRLSTNTKETNVKNEGMVPEGGFEPPTQRFSVACSTN